MSQRRDGAYRAYRGPSRSPPGDDQISPTNTMMHRLPLGNNPARYDMPFAGTASSSNPLPPLPSPSKALGVPSILNPSAGEPSLYREPMSLPSTHRDIDPTSTPNHGPYGGQAYSHRVPSHGSYTGTPVAAQSVAEQHQHSPASPHALPALNNPRKILSPKAPRTVSVNRGYGGQDYETRRPSFPTTPSLSKRRYEPEAPEQARRQLPGFPPQPGLPPIPLASRSLSQPLSRPPSIPQSRGLRSPPPPADQTRPLPGPSPPQYHHTPRGHRSFTMAGPSMENTSPWKENAPRPGERLAASLHGGEEAYMTLPGSDVPIPVQVDYSQASKKADEKRQRNAKASTRHRRKKKTLQEENVKQLQEMRDEREAMAHEIEDLRRQRDFYREERNRLRDLVLRTPAISELAAGPSTPASGRGGGSYAERSPIGPPSQMATPSLGYASEASSTAEPARRRRRTEDHGEFSMPSYGTPTGASSGSVPSVHGLVYGGPPRPPSASSVASVERLPPLRVMEGHASSGAHEHDPRTGQWVPVQNRTFETGWATGQRPMGDEPPRQ